MSAKRQRLALAPLAQTVSTLMMPQRSSRTTPEAAEVCETRPVQPVVYDSSSRQER